MPGGKYVLCMPCCGFHDILCQTEKAWEYAEKHGRILVVDARKSSLQTSFKRYFSTEAKDVFLHPGEALLRHFDRLEAYPSCLRGQVTRRAQKAIFVRGEEARFDTDARQALTFDMTRPYQEDVLVHHACGGGGRWVAWGN